MKTSNSPASAYVTAFGISEHTLKKVNWLDKSYR